MLAFSALAGTSTRATHHRAGKGKMEKDYHLEDKEAD